MKRVCRTATEYAHAPPVRTMRTVSPTVMAVLFILTRSVVDAIYN